MAKVFQQMKNAEYIIASIALVFNIYLFLACKEGEGYL